MNYETAVQEAKDREGNRELSDEAALALCAGWMSSGTVGRYLAAVATGAWSPKSLRGGAPDDENPETNGALFRTDLFFTFKDEASEMLVWSMLGTWSMNGGDND